uniref:Uncharacterized LOC100176616 n=1 Tax=Ciona intestinalis TaxID=7719 RepID=F6YKH1_CIOIN|nr:uncharacterized protein LOC100176616 isoform X1 [Ciona intestinalis]|eukprot:XP_002120876.2 uncharacterized protein LOC100176616 isoform X1 [Ciona intestinalis]
MKLWFILLSMFGYCLVDTRVTTAASPNIPPFPLPLSTEDRKEFVCRPQRKIHVQGDANELPDWLIRRYGVALEYNNARRSCCLLDVDVMVLRSCVDGNRRSALDTFCNGEVSRDPDRRHPCCYSLSSQRYLCFKQYHDYVTTEGSIERTQSNNEETGALTQPYVDRWCVKQAILDIDETSVDTINGNGRDLSGLSKDGDYCCRLPGRFRLSCFQMKMQAAQDERCHVVDDVCCHVTGEERSRCFLKKKGNKMKQETGIETTDVGLEPNETLEESKTENDVTEADDVTEEDDDLIEENPEESDYFLEENRDDAEENIEENNDVIEETSRDRNERVRFTKEHSDVTRENNTTAEDSEDSIEQENENLFIVEEKKSENSTEQENYDVIEENSGGGNNGNAKHRRLKPKVRSKIRNNGRPKSDKRRRNRLKAATMLRRCCQSGRNQHNNNTCTIGTAIEYTSSMKIIGRRQRCAIAYYRCCKQALEKTVTSQAP